LSSVKSPVPLPRELKFLIPEPASPLPTVSTITVPETRLNSSERSPVTSKPPLHPPTAARGQ
ncbi:putative transmembrane protein ORF68, partial [Clarias magur]